MASVEAPQAGVAGADTQPTASGPASSLAAYFANWSSRVDQARASQPDWLPPLMTLSPLLTQLQRWDAFDESLGNGARVLDLGGEKGLFLVPTTTNEVDLGVPTYEKRYNVQPAAGLADWQFLLVKQRLLSANAQNGDYVFTADLAAQAPIGAAAFTNNAFVIAPGLAAGKGFGDLDVQAGTSFAVPTSHEHTIGTAWATNVAFQYRLAEVFWPEFEVNWTRWLDGTQRGGADQVFLTVGMIMGPFQLTQSVGVSIGAGYQFAVAPAQRLEPALVPEFRHNLIFSARIPF